MQRPLGGAREGRECAAARVRASALPRRLVPMHAPRPHSAVHQPRAVVTTAPARAALPLALMLVLGERGFLRRWSAAALLPRLLQATIALQLE